MYNLKGKYGNWALITGASEGIGKEYATLIASEGVNVVLIARSEEKLLVIKQNLMSKYSVKVRGIAVDLTTEDGIDKIKSETNDLEIGLLVNNVGREDSNHFLKIPIEKHLETVNLNIKAPLLLTHHFGKKMIAKKRGGIITMSSIVAFQGVPYIANYAGTKAYNLIFSEGIAAEFKNHNIDVLAVTPGFTKTNLASVYDFSGTPFKPLTPNYVVKKALKSIGKKRLSIPGFINQFLYWSGKFLFSRNMNTSSFGMVFKKVLHKTL